MEIDKNKLKNFLTLIKDKTNITALELIEKDFYINVLLSKLYLVAKLSKSSLVKILPFASLKIVSILFIA